MNKRLHPASLALLLALAACGGSGDDHSGSPQANANPGAADAFFARVQALIATSPDNTEPQAIDAIAVTAPETIEPAPL